MSGSLYLKLGMGPKMPRSCSKIVVEGIIRALEWDQEIKYIWITKEEKSHSHFLKKKKTVIRICFQYWKAYLMT